MLREGRLRGSNNFFELHRHYIADITTTAVVLNRGAAEPLGAVKSSRGAANQ